MPKNVSFSLKDCKNRQTLDALPPDSIASGGWGLRPQTLTSVILHYEFFSLPTKHGINQMTLFSCNCSGSAPGFRR